MASVARKNVLAYSDVSSLQSSYASFTCAKGGCWKSRWVKDVGSYSPGFGVWGIRGWGLEWRVRGLERRSWRALTSALCNLI